MRYLERQGQKGVQVRITTEDQINNATVWAGAPHGKLRFRLRNGIVYELPLRDIRNIMVEEAGDFGKAGPQK